MVCSGWPARAATPGDRRPHRLPSAPVRRIRGPRRALAPRDRSRQREQARADRARGQRPAGAPGRGGPRLSPSPRLVVRRSRAGSHQTVAGSSGRPGWAGPRAITAVPSPSLARFRYQGPQFGALSYRFSAQKSTRPAPDVSKSRQAQAQGARLIGSSVPIGHSGRRSGRARYSSTAWPVGGRGTRPMARRMARRLSGCPRKVVGARRLR